jgi:hypothetical protein
MAVCASFMYFMQPSMLLTHRGLQRDNVRYGSQADVRELSAHARLVPEADTSGRSNRERRPGRGTPAGKAALTWARANTAGYQ